MSTRAVIIDGETLWVEVDDEVLPTAAATAASGLVERDGNLRMGRAGTGISYDASLLHDAPSAARRRNSKR